MSQPIYASEIEMQPGFKPSAPALPTQETKVVDGKEIELSVEVKNAYFDALMADDPQLDPTENSLLYEASWNAQGCGNCCCGDNTNQETVAENSTSKPDVKIKVTDRHIKITTTTKLMPGNCIDVCKCPQTTTTKMDTSAIHAVISSQKAVSCCSYFVLYLTWLFCGCCGGHYCLHKKRFRQTTSHKLYLVCWFLTLGFFGVGWLIDGYRVFFWLQS